LESSFIFITDRITKRTINNEIVLSVEVDQLGCQLYQRFPIDAGIVYGTTEDANGNISTQKEALTHEALAIAIAARNGRVATAIGREDISCFKDGTGSVLLQFWLREHFSQDASKTLFHQFLELRVEDNRRRSSDFKRGRNGYVWSY
jgi:hypothetical protein